MGTSSFYAALSGLSSNRQAIDVIGNNLANLNTVGFKKSSVTFADVFSASLATSVNGAGNPLEIGLGTRVAAIDQVYSQGSLQTTGQATDMAIQGAGFFILEGNDGRSFTRAGKFSFNKDGDLVTPTGKQVMGYPADALGNIQLSSDLQGINVSSQTNSSPNATTMVFSSTLLDADADPDAATGEFSTPIRVFDSLGVPHTLNFVFRRVDPADPAADPAAAVEWAFDIRMDASEILTDPGNVAMGNVGEEFSLMTGALVPDGASIAGGTFSGGRMTFDANGVLTEVDFAGAATGLGALGAFNIAAPDVDPNGIVIPPDGGPAGAIQLASGADDIDFEWDVFNDDGTTNITSFASDAGSGTSSVNQDGFGVGVLSSVVVAPDGTVTGLFTNGDVRNLAQVALANFNNPQGLLASGNTEFVQTPGSGQPSIGVPENGGRGSVAGSTIELSNVDLAEEFTSLIITERGFQANSRVITTNDQLLQEAINLSR
jgi:flagellar hook protein FlgE